MECLERDKLPPWAAALELRTANMKERRGKDA